MVWSIIGWTLLGLLGLVLLVLLLPTVAYISYREGELSVKVRILFVKLTVFPMKEGKPKKERKAKKKKPKKTEEKEEKPEKEEKEQTLEEKLAFVKRILAAAKETMGILLRFVWITGFEFQAAVNTGDAYDTAILYGRLQGVVGAIHALLENTFNIRFKRMVLIPDFGGEYPDSLLFSCKVSCPPVIMLVAAFKGFFNFLHSRPQKQPARPAAKPAAPGPQRSEPHGQQ